MVAHRTITPAPTLPATCDGDVLQATQLDWVSVSGRQDLNLRPPGSKPGALTKLRHSLKSSIKIPEGSTNRTSPPRQQQQTKRTRHLEPVQPDRMPIIQQTLNHTAEPAVRVPEQPFTRLFPPTESDLAVSTLNLLRAHPSGLFLVADTTQAGRRATAVALAATLVGSAQPGQANSIGAPRVELFDDLSYPNAAAAAFDAAENGVLALSTLHGWSAASAMQQLPVRLKEARVARSRMANVLVGVLAQRQVRTLCQACSPDRLPVGCFRCSAGWFGSTLVGELMPHGKTAAVLAVAEAPEQEIDVLCDPPFTAHAAHLMLQGRTTADALATVLQRGTATAAV